jgi:hypothetical protein
MLVLRGDERTTRSSVSPLTCLMDSEMDSLTELEALITVCS